MKVICTRCGGTNLFDSYTYDVKNTDVDKFKMSDVMNVYRIINL